MTTKPIEFMSQKHIDEMNRLLANDAESLAECSKLPKDFLIVYALENDDSCLYWQMHFERKSGIRFRLGEPFSESDVVLRSSWRSFIAAEKVKREGRFVNPFKIEDGEGALEIIGGAFSAGAKAAQIETVLPDV